MALLILDKSALRGCSRESLREYACSHTFLYTYALDYEIRTEHLSKGRAVPPHSYYGKLRNVELYACELVFRLMQREERTHQPTCSIIDAEASTGLRRWVEGGEYANATRMASTPLVGVFEKYIPCHLRGFLENMWDDRFNAVFDHVRNDMAGAGVTAACAYVRMISPDKAEELFAMAPARPDAPPAYVLKKGWITFTYYRLLNYLCFWYRLNMGRADGGLTDHNIANAYMDLHYLSLLDHADGVWSGDRHLIDMARAFFPGKTVLELPGDGQARGHDFPEPPREGRT